MSYALRGAKERCLIATRRVDDLSHQAMPTIIRGDDVMELTPLLREDDLPLQRLFRWEAEYATRIYLTQPLGNGESRDYSWAQTLDEARRMAAHQIGRANV